MKLLAVETSSSALSVAIFEDGKLLLQNRLDYKKTHSERLIPMIQSGLAQLDLKPADLDVFAASLGPGSFTGLRIGLTTIKVMAQALGKPVIGVSTLEALAYNLPYTNQTLYPIIDAQRDTVYWGKYQWRGLTLDCLEAPQILAINELIDKAKEQKEPVLFLGDGVIKFQARLIEAFGNQQVVPAAAHLLPDAASVGVLALEKYRQGKLQSPASLLPIYMRKSQAESQYEERMRREAEHE